MLGIGLYEPAAWLLAWFYKFTHNYILAISLMALLVMLITAPLVLKSTKGMLEMQKLQPHMKRLQAEHRGDRQKLNEEMMKLYQEHKVNPLASCLPLVLQFPVFIIMFRVLHGLTSKGPNGTFLPKYIPSTGANSAMYDSLVGQTKMMSWGLDLAQRPITMVQQGFWPGIVYALLVVALGVLYFVQQRMVAARATVAPTMSATQQKLMQYLPVVFAVFLFFYLTGLVIYYMAQAIFRIGLQYYITRKFYRGEESLGRQAIAAGNEAREIAKKDGNGNGGGGGGLFANARRELSGAKNQQPATKGGGSAKSGAKAADAAPAPAPVNSKRVTQPKGRPTNTRPQSTGRAARPGGSGSSKKKP